ncbi:MAG: lamin tail domain-containing protein [Candidatus Nealsonbacteria bacterium]|nr:lamin tail domain-containing protein [Candidatus Nealsonbacteria bacterium]
MVKAIKSIGGKLSLQKTILTIAIAAIVFSFLSNYSLAGQTKVNQQEMQRIKQGLDIVKTASSFGSVLLDDGGLMKALNTVIKGGSAATDVTYGLLVLSAVNEMELMDLVLSQEYKTIEREYFEQILDERTNLISYWRGVGFDLPKVLSGQITGPMAGLTLNSFAMTNKIIHIATAFEVLKKGQLYDGLWYYFDLRKNSNEPHEIAWREAKMILGFATNSVGFHGPTQRQNKRIELEAQFTSLWDKWGLYATPGGISNQYQEQAKEEMRSMLAVAAETQRLAEIEKQKEPSWLSKQIDELKTLASGLGEKIHTMVSKIADANPFSAGPIVQSPKDTPVAPVRNSAGLQSPKNRESEDQTPTERGEEARLPREAGLQVPREVPREVKPQAPQEIESEKTTEEKVKDKEVREEEKIKIVEIKPTPDEPGLCEKIAGDLPKRYRAFINEVAWMGSQNSPNDEWIELKNIWGLPVNLNGWQLQDKDQQIKIIFEENDTIPASGYYLLERTNDDSTPKAKADKIYTGALGNNNEALYLFDNDCRLEDEVIADPSWPGGDNTAKKTIERLDPLYWYTSASIGGSAGKNNGTPPAILKHPSAPTPPLPASAPTYLTILIDEVRIDGDGNIKNDSVKLYNPNDTAVDLTNWYLQRKTANSSVFSTYAPKSLFAGKSIEANGYFLIAHASSTFATSADAITTYSLTRNNTLVLKNPNGEIADTAEPAENNEETASLSVVINEIAWAGAKANSADEWIELYNNTTSGIDLTNWSILKDDEEWIIFSTSSIVSQGYYLLERSDDQTISDITADQFFTGALSNSGQKLELKNAAGDLMDLIDFSSNWPAGEAAPNYLSMERISSTFSDWASNNRISTNGLGSGNNAINGTPKEKNSVSKSFTEVVGDRVFSDDFTLTKLGSPYIWEGSLIMEQGTKLTVEPGVTVKFKHTAPNQPHAQVKIKGEMEAIGTNEQEITFTSFQENNYWDGLYFENSNSTLENVIIDYAGKWHHSGANEFPPYTYGAIYIDGGTVSIKNSLIQNSETFGVWLKNSPLSLIDGTTFKANPGTVEKPAAIYVEQGNPTIQNSNFEDNNIGIFAANYSTPAITDNSFNGNQAPVKISSLFTDISDNIAQNNDINGILLEAFGFNGETSEVAWQKNDLPYVVESALDVAAGKILEIESGVVVKFKGEGAINIGGTLNAKGKNNDKIIFTSISDDEYGGDTNNDGNAFPPAAGQWKFLKFLNSSAEASLDNVLVRYGGFLGIRGGVSARDGAIKIENNTLTIKDSIIENNRVGIEMINSDFDGKSKNISVRNNAIGVYVEGACPNLNDIIFEQNTEYDIFPIDCQN